jgi:hypothetical protein
MPEIARPTADDISTGAAWTMLVERLEEVGRLVWDSESPGPPPRPAEGLRYLLRFLAAGISLCVEHDDTDTPELGRMIEDRMSWGLDNPDTLYTYTRVRGDASYRLVGRRGTARHVEFQVNTGHYSDGDFTGWRAVSALPGDDVVDDDGRFEIVLSRDRPAHPPGDSNWMALGDEASFLLIRQYFDDWENERPWDLAIERIDGTLPPASLSRDVMATRLGLLLDWLDIGLNCWNGISEGFLDAPVGDITPFIPPDEASGLKGQAYGMAPWRCAPDEAVVLELRPPACRMWGISLCDRYWQSIDFADRQSSINDSQATLDEGGVFVGVIAHGDPGVANWLDPGDETEGTIAVRYLMPDGVPTVRYRTVPRADLDASLPAGTPRVTAGERYETLRRRRLAVARRYRR